MFAQPGDHLKRSTSSITPARGYCCKSDSVYYATIGWWNWNGSRIPSRPARKGKQLTTKIRNDWNIPFLFSLIKVSCFQNDRNRLTLLNVCFLNQVKQIVSCLVLFVHQIQHRGHAFFKGCNVFAIDKTLIIVYPSWVSHNCWYSWLVRHLR